LFKCSPRGDIAGRSGESSRRGFQVGKSEAKHGDLSNCA
jgi:hypothetical protein